MSYVRINDTLINLDYLVRADLYPEERPGRSTVLLTLDGAKPVKLEGEAAEAYIRFVEKELDDVVDLNTFKRPAVVEAEKLKFTETPPSIKPIFSQPGLTNGTFPVAKCPVAIYHPELTVPCPACGLKPVNS